MRRRKHALAPIPVGNKIFRRLLNIDVPLLLIVLALGCIGMVALYSASDVFPSRFESQMHHWGLTLMVVLIVSQVSPRHMQQLAVPMYVVTVVLLLAVDLFGETRKGATRWLNLGVTSIQPSELMKIAMPLMLAWWFHQRQSMPRMMNFLCASMILLVPIGLILREPDLGTALLVLVAGLAVIFFAGLSWKLIIPPVLLVIAGVALIVANEDTLCAPGANWVVLHDYQVKRVCTLLNPDVDPLGRGFHILQSTIAIGSGGVTGKGFLQGTQSHLDFIPESTTDFIFAAYAEEFGLVGNGVLLLFYLLLVWRGLMIASRAVTEFSRLLACGVTLIFFACVFVNIGMVSGVLPVVGVPLPFLSYGGTALVTFGAGIGVLMSISGQTRQARREPD